MKKILAIAFAGAMAVSVIGTALADNPNWTEEKRDQVNTNRCANAGIGNDGEFLRRECITGVRDETGHDIDPGNSGAHNANNE